MTGEPVAIGVELDGFKQLTKDLRAAEPVLAREFKKAMKAGADVVAQEYEAQARRFSSRIPDSIATGVTLTGAYVKSGGPKAPQAAALENMGRSGTFRHPVFGNNDVWVDQQAHPAAVPALQVKADAVADLADQAMAKYGEAAGFH